MLALLLLWGTVSILAAVMNWAELFPALGSVALCIGFATFLVDRYQMAEERRLWDHQVEVQIRMIWRYVRRTAGQPGQAKESDPLSLADLESRISDSFDGLLSSKNAEEKQETYRYEMAFSIVGTLQWGFGGMLMSVLHG